jgi:hypothetical protein
MARKSFSQKMRVIARLAFDKKEEALADDLCDSCRALVLAVREYTARFNANECEGEQSCHVSVVGYQGLAELQCDPRPQLPVKWQEEWVDVEATPTALCGLILHISHLPSLGNFHSLLYKARAG